MIESEKSIEERLIYSLTQGTSQWKFCPEINNEAKLWQNLRDIIENNNRGILNGVPLNDSEFQQIKNQLSFPSFYRAANWLVGENGKAHVKVQRGNDNLQLLVFNKAHVTGGTSVYQVIHQFHAENDEEDEEERKRRFDVTLLINGLPLIHIELKKSDVPYKNAFEQIVKYVKEGKFTGLFSCTQMFVVSNLTETKYIAAARYDEMNFKFLSGWVDENNQPVAGLFDFAKDVLKIPQAHEMISQYSVLDRDEEKIILLRPYQIHAIEKIREASKDKKSGYIWHTTGSGKTLTSYKASRNLLQDIPNINKTVFLVDRNDLNEQTTNAFESYAENDYISVDDTENTDDLIDKLKSSDRQMIVTTRQKLQKLINKFSKDQVSPNEGQTSPNEDQISALKNKLQGLFIAFVVDECHRTISPDTKRDIDKFFNHSLWYGFTGTPRFGDNCYELKGDLPRTTEQLFGPLLHSYTVKDAIHDGAVLGFQVEHLGPQGLETSADGLNINEDLSVYSKPAHMMEVINDILNKCNEKFGISNGPGKTYEAILTTGSIPMAQRYYSLLKRVKNGETNITINEEIKKVLPDFPKFAITYSVTEDETGSIVNQEKMKESIDDYNRMFGTHYDISQLRSYNTDLTQRLSRKKDKYLPRSEQLDLVIVADRLLTGFDAPCLSTLFMDRQPMKSHDIIQAFSRTNRIFDAGKKFGQIVTFQSPETFRTKVKEAVKLFSQGSDTNVLFGDFEEAEKDFRSSLIGLRCVASTPKDVLKLSTYQKKRFINAFQQFDTDYKQFKSFTKFGEVNLQKDYDLAIKDIEDYCSYYRNIVEEFKHDPDNTWDNEEDVKEGSKEQVDLTYELVSYGKEQIDYEYIIALMGRYLAEDIDSIDSAKKEQDRKTIEDNLNVFEKTHAKAGAILRGLWEKAVANPSDFKNQDLMSAFEKTKGETIKSIISSFASKWCVDESTIRYIASRYYPGAEEVPFQDMIREKSDFDAFENKYHQGIRKFAYLIKIKDDLKSVLDEEIIPLKDQE